jgi:ParB family chromosome partitioning protein
MGHARALLGVRDERVRSVLAKRVIAQQLSVRAVEELVRRSAPGRAPSAIRGEPTSKRPHIKDLEERFRSTLGLKVQIEEGPKANTGRVVFHYASLDDFDRLLERLGIAV